MMNRLPNDLIICCAILLQTLFQSEAFTVTSRHLIAWPSQQTSSLLRQLSSSSGSQDSREEEIDIEAIAAAAEAAQKTIQWELFTKHQSKSKTVPDGTPTSWKGIWTTYDYMGDVQDETIGAVNYDKVSDDEIHHSQQVVVGAKKSDCATCFDTMDVKTIPIASLNPDNLMARKNRCASCGMVTGPSVLRNGVMATELVLSHNDGRVRVVLQHAPVWERGTEEVGPPQALKLFRCLVSRETVRDNGQPPTPENNQNRIQSFLEGTFDSNSDPNPLFYRPVKPFDWHKHWAGTSWTWGPSSGDRGWSIENLEDQDQWHGNAPVELWNLRLPDGIFIQAPRLVSGAETGLFRLAWLPNSDILLRLEGGVLALQPLMLDDDDSSDVVGFAPPALASLRCDVLQKQGDLDGEPQFVIDTKRQQEEAMAGSGESIWDKIRIVDDDGKEDTKNEGKEESLTVDEESQQQSVKAETQVAGRTKEAITNTAMTKEKEEEMAKKSENTSSQQQKSSPSSAKKDDDLKAIRDALKL